MPFVTNVARPGTIASAIISSSYLGTGGTKYYIKVIECQVGWNVPTADITGDGDSAPVWAHSSMLYATWALRGIAISNADIGVVNLIDDADSAADSGGGNPITTLSLFYHNGRKITFTKAIIERADLTWLRRGTLAGLRIIGRATQTEASAFEPS